jgi:hypothetical protein
MKMHRNKPDLQHESLKNHPFGVPEGYFDGFATRLHQRIKEEESSGVPVRRMGSVTRWLSTAAAILGAALLTTVIIKFSGAGTQAGETDPDLALLERLQVFDNDLYLYDLLDDESAELSDDEAFAAQAVDYLAMSDVALDLLYDH